MADPSRTPDPAMSEALRQAESTPDLSAELEGLYQQLEAQRPDNAICRECGQCCNFVEYGHRLYVSTAEVALLLSQEAPSPEALQKGLCPYQVGNACKLREKRPLGCRLFFCHLERDPQYQKVCESFHAALRTLHQRRCVPYIYAEFTTWLTAANS